MADHYNIHYVKQEHAKSLKTIFEISILYPLHNAIGLGKNYENC